VCRETCCCCVRMLILTRRSRLWRRRNKLHRNGEFTRVSFYALGALMNRSNENFPDFKDFSTCSRASVDHVLSLTMFVRSLPSPDSVLPNKKRYKTVSSPSFDVSDALRALRSVSSPVDCSVYVTRYIPRIKDPSTPWVSQIPLCSPKNEPVMVILSNPQSNLHEITNLYSFNLLLIYTTYDIITKYCVDHFIDSKVARFVKSDLYVAVQGQIQGS